MRSLVLVATVTTSLLSLSDSLADTGILRKGDTGVHRFELTAQDGRTVVTLAWRDRAAEMDLSVQSANGTSVRGSIEGFEIRRRDFSYQVIIEPQAASTLGWGGTWTVRLSCLATHRKRPAVPYTVTVDTGAGASVEIEGLGGVPRAGGEAVLEVRVRGAGESAVVVDRCWATLTPLDGGEVEEVSLADDGEGVDREAGDGIYAGPLRWRRHGEVVVAVAVEGHTEAGRPFRRDELERIEVRPARR